MNFNLINNLFIKVASMNDSNRCKMNFENTQECLRYIGEHGNSNNQTQHQPQTQIQQTQNPNDLLTRQRVFNLMRQFQTNGNSNGNLAIINQHQLQLEQHFHQQQKQFRNNFNDISMHDMEYNNASMQVNMSLAGSNSNIHGRLSVSPISASSRSPISPSSSSASSSCSLSTSPSLTVKPNDTTTTANVVTAPTSITQSSIDCSSSNPSHNIDDELNNSNSSNSNVWRPW